MREQIERSMNRILDVFAVEGPDPPSGAVALSGRGPFEVDRRRPPAEPDRPFLVARPMEHRTNRPDGNDLIDRETPAVRPRDRERHDFTRCARPELDVHVLLMTPATVVRPDGPHSANAGENAVLPHNAVTAIPEPLATNHLPPSHQSVFLCLAMQTPTSTQRFPKIARPYSRRS